MLVAALWDLGLDLSLLAELAQEAGSLTGGVEFTVLRLKGEASGLRLGLKYQASPKAFQAETLYAEIERLTGLFKLSANYLAFCLKGFKLLVAAEAQAHGQNPSSLAQLHLHEASDIVLDLVAVGLALERLKVNLEDITCLSPVFYGGGQKTFSHGSFELPAPATRNLIDRHQIPVVPGPVAEELLTPTGAAILGALAPTYLKRSIACLSGRLGQGYGSIELSLPGALKNCLRVYLE